MRVFREGLAGHPPQHAHLRFFQLLLVHAPRRFGSPRHHAGAIHFHAGQLHRRLVGVGGQLAKTMKLRLLVPNVNQFAADLMRDVRNMGLGNGNLRQLVQLPRGVVEGFAVPASACDLVQNGGAVTAAINPQNHPQREKKTGDKTGNNTWVRPVQTNRREVASAARCRSPPVIRRGIPGHNRDKAEPEAIAPLAQSSWPRKTL
jgi:hypothetical protein